MESIADLIDSKLYRNGGVHEKDLRLDLELTVEERNLLSAGYKNVIGFRRDSWRIMSSIEQKEESKGNENNVKIIKGYHHHKVEEELSKICNDILTNIDKHLIPSSTCGEAAVFYYKIFDSIAQPIKGRRHSS